MGTKPAPTQTAVAASAAPASEQIAESLVRISIAMERLSQSGLNRRGLVALLRDSTGHTKSTIEQCLAGLEGLAAVYVTPEVRNKIRREIS